MAAKREKKSSNRIYDKSPEKMQKTVITLVIVVLFLIIALLTYSFVRPKNIGSTSATMIARQGEIEQKVKSTAVIIRDERVAITPVSGVVHYLVDDNSRVPVSTDVVEVVDSELLDLTRPASSRVEQEINNFIAKSTLERNQIRDLLNEVRVQIATKESQVNIYEQNGDTKNLNKVKKEITELQAREIDYLNEISRIELEISDAAKLLEESAKAVSSSLDRALAVIKNSEPAIISRKTDGLEHLLRPENPDILDYVFDKNSYALTELQDNTIVSAGQAVFREIKNYQTYVLVQIQVKEGTLKQDGRIAVRFPKLATEAVAGTVLKFKCIDENESLYSALIALDRFATSLVDLRTQECEVVTKSFSGIVVKNSCITVQSGSEGVMVLKGSKYEFVGVKILGSNNEESVITGIREGDKILLKP